MKKIKIVAFWMPVIIPDSSWYMDYMKECLGNREDIAYIDLQNDTRRRALAVLHAADLVVVGLPQSGPVLDRYFSSAYYRFGNVCYVIMNYYGNHRLNRYQIMKDYRIPAGDIAVLPHNIHIPYMTSFMKPHELWSDQNIYLREETDIFRERLGRVATMILRKIS